MKIKAKKALGQNFLQDELILDTISTYYDIFWKNIIEVWPGYGALTEFLLPKNPKSLHLVELDMDMIEILEKRTKNGELKIPISTDFQIFHQDVLKFQPKFWWKIDSKSSLEWQEKDYSVIANIPYYITSPILEHFLYKQENKPEKMLILMQKEVGERILEWAIKNDKEEKTKKTRSSVLSLMIAKKCFTEKVCLVPREAFHPAPKVDSIVIAFESHSQFNDIDDTQFLEFIKLAFVEPRKKLQNNLLKAGFEKEKINEIFSKLSLGEMVRGEELWVEKFIDLMKAFQ